MIVTKCTFQKLNRWLTMLPATEKKDDATLHFARLLKIQSIFYEYFITTKKGKVKKSVTQPTDGEIPFSTDESHQSFPSLNCRFTLLGEKNYFSYCMFENLFIS